VTLLLRSVTLLLRSVTLLLRSVTLLLRTGTESQQRRRGWRQSGRWWRLRLSRPALISLPTQAPRLDLPGGLLHSGVGALRVFLPRRLSIKNSLGSALSF